MLSGVLIKPKMQWIHLLPLCKWLAMTLAYIWKKMRGADLEIGSRFDNNFMMGQCFYMPLTYSKQLLEFKNTWTDIELHPTGLDSMLADFLKSRREKHWIQVPNLVDHRVGKSLIDSRRSSKRQSKTFKDALT